MDEATKKLVGDCAPQRIVASAPVVTAAAAPGGRAGKGSGSAWNTAGTVEEADKSAWAKVTLEGLLEGKSLGSIQYIYI